MKVFDQIQRAIVQAEKVERSAIGTEEFEHEFISVLNLIKANIVLRPQVVAEFSKMLRDQSHGPYALIEFCMQELRWEEMRDEAERIYRECHADAVRRKAFGKPLQHVMELDAVLSSFSDAWERRDLFSYYDDRRRMS